MYVCVSYPKAHLGARCRSSCCVWSVGKQWQLNWLLFVWWWVSWTSGWLQRTSAAARTKEQGDNNYNKIQTPKEKSFCRWMKVPGWSSVFPPLHSHLDFAIVGKVPQWQHNLGHRCSQCFLYSLLLSLSDSGEARQQVDQVRSAAQGTVREMRVEFMNKFHLKNNGSIDIFVMWEMSSGTVPALLWSDEVGQLSKPPQSCSKTPGGAVLNKKYTENSSSLLQKTFNYI